jgi:hypothetical protein
MSGTITITVRALAYGGKFIGQPVGFASVEIIKDGEPAPVAKGKTDQGLLPNTDGSGVTEKIMAQPYLWGQPISADQATYFTAEIPLDEPSVLLLSVASNANPDIKAYCYRQAIPNVPLTGDKEVVVVLPGLLTEITSPPAIRLTAGIPAHITATVRMMCGCKIDDHFWPVKNFSVQATVTGPGPINAQSKTVDLTYTGILSEFTAPFPFSIPGTYTVIVTAKEYNGNLGITKPQAVIVA